MSIRTVYSTNDAMKPENRGRPAELNEFGCAIAVAAGPDGDYAISCVDTVNNRAAMARLSRDELCRIRDAIELELRGPLN